MNKVRVVAAVLLALPLLGFGAAYYIHPPALPPIEGSPSGIALLHLMRSGGLSYPITASHVLAGIFLLIPRSRFLAALLQLPITIGILAFHLTMWREGTPVAIVLLLLNFLVLAEPERLRALVAKTRVDGE